MVLGPRNWSSPRAPYRQQPRTAWEPSDAENISSFAMSYYKETDPLLPNDRGAPEIHGSRASSINDVLVAEITEGDSPPPRRRRASGDLMAMLFGLCFFVILALTFSPESWLDDVFGDRRPVPQTIDQRVNRILTDTPLIGPDIPKLFLTFLSNI